MNIKIQSSKDKNFFSDLKNNLEFDSSGNNEIQKITKSIVSDIKRQGDKALIEFTGQLDHLEVNSVSQLEVSKARLEKLLKAFQRKPKKILL